MKKKRVSQPNNYYLLTNISNIMSYDSYRGSAGRGRSGSDKELGIVMIIMVRATFIEARTEVEAEEEVEACCIVVDVEAIVGL